MHHSVVGAWSCMKKIFPPYRSFWNRTWIYTMCRWIPHIIKKIPNFKAFIKPYMLRGGDRLVGHTKTQQFRFYMRDDGVTAMQFKLLCTTPNWDSYEGILMWRQDKDENCLLSGGEPIPCKPDLWGMGRKSSKVYPNILNIEKIVWGKHHKSCEGHP